MLPGSRLYSRYKSPTCVGVTRDNPLMLKSHLFLINFLGENFLRGGWYFVPILHPTVKWAALASIWSTLINWGRGLCGTFHLTSVNQDLWRRISKCVNYP